MYAADSISTYVNAPITDTWEKTATKRNPLLYDETLYQYICSLIRQHTGSNKIQHLYSWWGILSKGDKLPSHTHTHPRPERTISGVVYEQGESCKLYVKNLNSEPQALPTTYGNTILFSANSEHWTETYTGTKVRRCIAFDFVVLNQKSCRCKSEICIRCVHYKLDRLGLQILAHSPAERERYIKQNLNEILREGLFNDKPIALSIDKNKYFNV